MPNNSFLGEIPTEKLDNTIKNSINRGEKHMKSVRKKKIAAAFALFSGISIANMAQPALAENIPIIGTVIHDVNNSLGINKDSKDYEKYAQDINKISKDNGIEVKVTKAILDNHDNLMLYYEIKNDKGFTPEDKKYFECNDLGIELTGIKRVSFQPNYNMAPEKAIKVLPALSKDGEMLDLQEDRGSINGRFIDNNTFLGMSEYNMSSFKNVPNKFKLKLDINKINFRVGTTRTTASGNFELHNPPTSIDGNWKLEFEVTKSKIQETKTIKPNISSEYVTIKDVTITPFTTDISVKIDFSKINKLKVIDENNKEYTNYNTINKKETEPKFSEITFRFMDINKDVKTLKLVFLNGNNEEVYSCSLPKS